MSAEETGGSGGLRRNSRAQLDRLLQEIMDKPERFSSVVEEIEAHFSEERAVLVLDISGFSRTTQRRGIVAFLLIIQQMKLISRPAVESNGGLIVKAEADNLYCLFETVDGAVKAASEIMERLDTANLVLPEENRLYAAIGIGFGRILNIDEEDMFGDEVNLACKLGEDVAEMRQILLTAAAAAQLKDVPTAPETISISGLSLTYHRLDGR